MTEKVPLLLLHPAHCQWVQEQELAWEQELALAGAWAPADLLVLLFLEPLVCLEQEVSGNTLKTYEDTQ